MTTPEKIILIPRSIFYYEISFSSYHVEANLDAYEILRKVLNSVNKANADGLDFQFQPIIDGYNWMKDIVFKSSDKFIHGKFIRLRQNSFPEIYKDKTRTLEEIEAEEEDSIAETTHFILDHRRKKIFLSIENNFHGTKIADFLSYINHINATLGIVDTLCCFDFIVNEKFRDFDQRAGRCSEMYARIHKDNIARLSKVEPGLYTAAKSAIEYSDAEYVELRYKIEWKTKTKTGLTDKIKKLAAKFRKHPEDISCFDKLKVKMEDTENMNRLTAFDLLSPKLVSSIKVQRKSKSKVILDIDMFGKMQMEMLRLFKR